MGKLNSDSGRLLLIRNCSCGGKPEGIVFDSKWHTATITCPKCSGYEIEHYNREEEKQSAVDRLIKRWNGKSRMSSFYGRSNA